MSQFIPLFTELFSSNKYMLPSPQVLSIESTNKNNFNLLSNITSSFFVDKLLLKR